jgi:hypothetical protein
VIISDTHRYVFVEQPHTACTAIQAELKEHYGGRRILAKHATYADFLRTATPEQKRYFVFSGVRNPLDEAVSMYFKFKTDWKSKYSRRTESQTLSKHQTAAFAFVAGEQGDFARYIRRFYRRPFDNDTLIYHKRMDEVIRFEHLQEDFSRTLSRLGLEQVRPVPLVNKTSERGTYLDYYPESLRGYAARIFGPFMFKWDYELPAEWVGVEVPLASVVLFRMLGAWRYVYRRYLRHPAHPATRLFVTVSKPIRRSAYRLLVRS